MEKPMSPVTQLVQTIRVSAQILKEFAQHIEQAEKMAVPGQKILIPFTRTITFIAEPDIKTHQLFGSYFTQAPTAQSPIEKAVEEAQERPWEVRAPGELELRSRLLKVENLTGTEVAEVTPH